MASHISGRPDRRRGGSDPRSDRNNMGVASAEDRARPHGNAPAPGVACGRYTRVRGIGLSPAGSDLQRRATPSRAQRGTSPALVRQSTWAQRACPNVERNRAPDSGDSSGRDVISRVDVAGLRGQAALVSYVRARAVVAAVDVVMIGTPPTQREPRPRARGRTRRKPPRQRRPRRRGTRGQQRHRHTGQDGPLAPAMGRRAVPAAHLDRPRDAHQPRPRRPRRPDRNRGGRRHEPDFGMERCWAASLRRRIRPLGQRPSTASVSCRVGVRVRRWGVCRREVWSVAGLVGPRRRRWGCRRRPR
jgi:hypothetical protein